MATTFPIRVYYSLAIGLCAAICFPVNAGAQAADTGIPGRITSGAAAQAAKPGSSFPAVLWPPVLTDPALRSSVSLSPAVEMVKCKLGQSYTQLLTVTNHTLQELAFEMVAQDVVVRDGTRVFVRAGDQPQGIAATAVFLPKDVTVLPEQSVVVSVTFTLPSETDLRAVVAMFRGSSKIATKGAVQMTASLGTLFTFTTSPDFKIKTAPITVSAQTATANIGIFQILTNTGSEPVVADGIAAVLDQSGVMVGKVPFESHRLLPGERLPCRFC